MLFLAKNESLWFILGFEKYEVGEINICWLFWGIAIEIRFQVTKYINVLFFLSQSHWMPHLRHKMLNDVKKCDSGYDWHNCLGTSLKQGEKVFKINVFRKCKWNDVTSKSLDCFAVVQRELVTVVSRQNEIAFCHNIVSYWLASCLN